MYRKKELIGIVLFVIVMAICILLSYIPFNSRKENSTEDLELKDGLILNVEGEVVRSIELQYSKPITYGVLFLRIQNSLNEYSDLSGFNMDERIEESQTIFIPSMDTGSQTSSSAFRVVIHSASLEELVTLPQIGAKRGQKILDYLAENGKIDSWETFFKIVGVPEDAKDQIKKQAIL